jgi:arginine utilization protein RocB
MLQCREDVLTFTKKLVNIESVVNTNGEKAIAQSLYSMISSMPYFSQRSTMIKSVIMFLLLLKEQREIAAAR